MESLLSLTSKRAGEWFKEELRQLGGIDHLVRTISASSTMIKADTLTWSTTLLEKLSKVDRCLKVLENVTHQNCANQEYLMEMDTGNFSKVLMRIYWVCHQQVILHPENISSQSELPVTKNLITTLLTTLKVLINLTHGSNKEGNIQSIRIYPFSYQFNLL